MRILHKTQQSASNVEIKELPITYRYPDYRTLFFSHFPQYPREENLFKEFIGFSISLFKILFFACDFKNLTNASRRKIDNIISYKNE